jgi:serine/threonine-protein kinase
MAIHDAGATHRALKPANIWILNDHEPKVLLSDCCIARFTEIAKRGRIRSFGLGMDFAETLIPLGALAYMSPEQVRGEPVDCRTDIFSLGVVLYEMLSGRHPFETRNSLSCISAILEAEPPSLLSKHVVIPPQLGSILRKALAKNREDRYQSIKELLRELDGARVNASLQRAPREMPAGIRRWFPPRFWRALGK